ncbi:hypothetical protein [Streptomyces sp. NPDC017529]|uniref:hypothetical protein n=1 Tax=Streptomyces sp. NPDC017529 TaxID=3365000 RepID=UPI00378CFFB1
MSAAQNAADAIQNFAHTVNDKGFDHPDTHAARDNALAAHAEARAVGATDDDIKNARR